MTTLENLKHYLKIQLNSKRADLNLSQEKMAEKVDITLRAYQNLEHGKSFCSAYALINFINNCNIDKDKLFSDFSRIINNTEDDIK